MTPLRQQMIDAMLLRGFSIRTQRSYLDAVTYVSRYYHCPPDKLSTKQLQAWFLYLVKTRHLSPATCRLYLNGIRFLYLQVLDWDSFDVELTVPKRKQRIPELLNHQEVARILNAGDNLKHRTMLSVCYACGLRLSELVALQLKHIDSERKILRIEQAKGAKDRQVILSDVTLQCLREYWSHYRPETWLFYGVKCEQPLSMTTPQRIFTQHKHRAGIQKQGGIHSLRHAYATHQLEAGMPIHQLQAQLGHTDIHSTLRYIHWMPYHQQAGHGTDLLKALAVHHDG